MEMTTIEFLRIETRGGNLVAVFDLGYQQWEPTGAGGSRYDDGTFCLNEESLRTRIANLKRDGRDTAVEDYALLTLTEIGYHRTDDEGSVSNVQR